MMVRASAFSFRTRKTLGGGDGGGNGGGGGNGVGDGGGLGGDGGGGDGSGDEGGGGDGGGAKDSISVAETNKLRESLGLAPLRGT